MWEGFDYRSFAFFIRQQSADCWHYSVRRKGTGLIAGGSAASREGAIGRGQDMVERLIVLGWTPSHPAAMGAEAR